jgi:murein DD-endopeptidase MepM/ murein hydrolase activator NlpD
MRPPPINRVLAPTLVALAGAVALMQAGPTAGADSGSGSSAQSLLSQVQSLDSRLAALPSRIGPLEARLASVQAAFQSDSADLAATTTRRALAKRRLAADQASVRYAQAVLARQLVADYEADEPDIVTVILESNGFADLIERLDFFKRVAQHNADVANRVRAARIAVSTLADQLGRLQQHQYAVTRSIFAQQSELDTIRVRLVDEQIGLQDARNRAAGQLHRLESQRAALAAAAARAARAQAGVGSGPSGASSGPVQTLSGGGFVFPLPAGTATPPSGWSLDQGVDISAPAHTPELAVGSGTIVLHGIGGFGPSAPVLHLDSGPYVYYGHAGPGNELPIGTHVSAGQTIAEIGAGDVGISTGPHLEIGFCDASGSPLGGQTASRMQALLLGAYH